MDRERVGSGITGGLFLIGLGVIWLADWWWPGIMVVLGIAAGSGLVFRGRYTPGIVVMAIFFGIPILTEAQIPWDLFAPMVLIGVGVIVVAKAFYLNQSASSTPTTQP
jgi:hypothetical protein